MNFISSSAVLFKGLLAINHWINEDFCTYLGDKINIIFAMILVSFYYLAHKIGCYMKFTTANSPFRVGFKENKILLAYTLIFLLFWISTFIGTTDVVNWFMENTLVIIFLSILGFTYAKFKFSDLTYTFIFIYLCLHIYGAKYTYAENPFGYWLKDYFHFERNHYDRIVHFSFGFMLAYPMRDFFLNKMKFPVWVAWLLPIEITLSFSCLYELIEWAVADVFFPEQGIAYLGTQGDIWDAQKDMFMAFCGAVIITCLYSSAKKMIRRKEAHLYINER